MVIVYRPNVPGGVLIPRNHSNQSLDSKNATSSLEKVPSTAAKKRFAAKLRKIRWRIYRDIDLKKGNIKKSLKYYERQVQSFLKEFSKKLKPKEPSIWKEKVAKTSVDVHAFKRIKMIKANVCENCSMKNEVGIDAYLLMIYAAYHFTKANRAALSKLKRKEAEYQDVEIDEGESGVDNTATVQEEVPVFVTEDIAKVEATEVKEKSTAPFTAEMTSKELKVFKPVDWSKCLMRWKP